MRVLLDDEPNNISASTNPRTNQRKLDWWFLSDPVFSFASIPLTVSPLIWLRGYLMLFQSISVY